MCVLCVPIQASVGTATLPTSLLYQNCGGCPVDSVLHPKVDSAVNSPVDNSGQCSAVAEKLRPQQMHMGNFPHVSAAVMQQPWRLPLVDAANKWALLRRRGRLADGHKLGPKILALPTGAFGVGG